MAWDKIPVSPFALKKAAHRNTLIFCSLAQRSEPNQQTLHKLFQALPPDALRVFDVSLRSTGAGFCIIAKLAKSSTVLKVNAAEAAQLASGRNLPSREESHVSTLAHQHGCPTIVITNAEHGAGILQENRWCWEPKRPVKVVDTIGSGDSFLAAFVANFIRNQNPKQCLQSVCHLEEWVATQRGATPTYNKQRLFNYL